MFDELQTVASNILREKLGTEREIAFTIPERAENGDATTPVALSLAKELHKKPHDIASTIAEHLRSSASVEKAEVAGPGYVNIWLTPEALLKELNRSREAATVRVKKNEAPVIIDYSAPNIAKPLGIHHILSTVIGQSLMNLYRHMGYAAIGINHLGDWGTQFGKLAVALKRWGTKPLSECTLDDLLALYVRFHDEVEKNASLEDEGREAFRKIEQGDNELRTFWLDVVKITMRELDRLYERLHVSFDHVHGESFYEDKMQPILDEGKKKKVFIEGKEGALIVEFSEETGLAPAIVVKADDATIYLTRDLATARYRIDTFHPQSLLYVVDVAQQYYFRQLFETLKRLGWDLPRLEHIYFGRMSFKDKKMSTRKGNILKLEEVLDEAVARAEKIIKERGETIHTDDPAALAEMMGTGAVVYGILSQNRKMDIVFDWDKMLSFEGNSAPYIQYTHARARSVLRKAAEEGIEISSKVHIEELSLSERILIRTLLLFPEILADALATHMPHKIAIYLYGLCQDFNAFYNKEPILKAPVASRNLRLQLTADTAQILKVAASLLTLHVPDRM
ncbi:MAG: hypothetical protein RIQ56_859 [Candidatus Parcubacteria bacterium]